MDQLSVSRSPASDNSRTENLDTYTLSEKEDSEDCSQEIIQIFEDEIVKFHSSVPVPMPFGIEEKKDEVVFADPTSGEGKRILADPKTEISELFAVLRQFVHPVCDNIGLIVNEVLERNKGVNDIDSTTGMSLLHYVIRAESVANDKLHPVEVLSNLLSRGADASQRTIFTDLNAFHLAAFFDCPLSLETMINTLPSEEVDRLLNSLSSEFDFGTPLHIAASNLSVNAAEILLKRGADLSQCDDSGRLPEHCLPSSVATSDRKKAETMRNLFRKRITGSQTVTDAKMELTPPQNTPASTTDVNKENTEFIPVESEMSGHREFSIGDHVVVSGSKKGVIRFIGKTKFAPGVWCGIELDDHIGKNDGSINNVRYFTCEATRGVFAPSNKLTHATSNQILTNGIQKKIVLHKGRKPPKHSCTSGSSSTNSSISDDVSRLQVGMTVIVDHLKEKGTIRFIGETDFASGIWVGLSLRRPLGKNNGTIQGRRYFHCKQGYGIMLRPARISVNGVNGAAVI